MLVIHISCGNMEKFRVNLTKKARVSDSEVGTAAIPQLQQASMP